MKDGKRWSTGGMIAVGRRLGEGGDGEIEEVEGEGEGEWAKR